MGHPSYFGEGQILGLSLAYFVIADSIGPCDTLDRAYPFVNNETVMFGFPDILFHPDDAFHRLLVHLNESRSDIVLVLFPEVESRKTDMVDIEDSERVRSIVICLPSEPNCTRVLSSKAADNRNRISPLEWS